MKILDDFVAGFRDHARTSANGTPGPVDGVEGSSESGSSRGLVQILFRFVEEVIGSADSLIEVYLDRIKLSV